MSTTFLCPICKGNKTSCIDSRAHNRGVRRRRVCKDCTHRFTTVESVEDLRPAQQETSAGMLSERVSALKGPDRSIDAELARLEGWAEFRVGPDYDGKNESVVLTPFGKKIEGFSYPPRGALPIWYHVPEYTRDCRDPAFPASAVREQLASSLRKRGL